MSTAPAAPPPSPDRSRRRAVLPVVAWLVAELAAFAALWLVPGTNYRETQHQRHEIATGAADSIRVAGGGPRRIGNDVIHPFLGYVTDPAINERERRRERGMLEVDGQGFFRRGPKEPPAPGDLRVAVFGGSVAFVLAFEGRDEITSALAAAPDGSSRHVHLECYAQAGYKQPQQLMALAWLLSIGEHFDVVVNLDGFNELPGSIHDNARRRINAFYPAKWSQRLGAQDDPEVIRQVGRLQLERERRSSLARRLDSRWVRSSAIVALTWAVVDRIQAQQIHELESVLHTQTTKRTFQRFGPRNDFVDDTAALDAIAELWGRASVTMAAIAEAHGARYYHFLQPNQYLPDSKPLSVLELRRAFREDSHYRPLVVQGYPRLRSVGARLVEEGINFHDLSMLFAGDSRDLYEDECCHLNSTGNQVLARAIADLVSRGEESRSIR